ncbi:MAG: hypothetical protein AAF436_06655 [Myxococcota bacterium]
MQRLWSLRTTISLLALTAALVLFGSAAGASASPTQASVRVSATDMRPLSWAWLSAPADVLGSDYGRPKDLVTTLLGSSAELASDGLRLHHSPDHGSLSLHAEPCWLGGVVALRYRR